MSNPAELRFEYEFGCLIIRATGRYLIEEKEVAILAIAQAIKVQPVSAALVDIRGLTGTFTFMDRYYLAALAGRHLTRVPIGVLARVEQTDPKRIGQMVALNRDVNITVFTDPAQVHVWLNKQTRPPF